MKKILKYLLLIITLVVIISSSLTYMYKDKIIQHFITEMNDKLNTPISVQKIDISLFDQLPYISVVLHQVVVQESLSNSKESLLKAQKISCALNPLDILMGDYSVQKLDIKDAIIMVRVDQYNTPNYLIFKKNEGDSSGGSVLNLRKVRLANSSVVYQNSYNDQHVSFETKALTSSLQSYGNVFDIKTNGNIVVNEITINRLQYLSDTPLGIKADLVYNQYKRTLDINPSSTTYQSSVFDISGQYGFEESKIKLQVASQGTNFIILKDLIPQRYLTSLIPYQYTGEASFELQMDGKINKERLPPTRMTFDVQNASVTHSQKTTAIDNANFTGYYHNYPKDSLSLKALSGQLNQQPFTGELSVSDFNNPFIDLKFEGTITGDTFQAWAELSQVESISGEIMLDFSLSGRTNDLKNKKTIPNIKTSGDIAVTNLNIAMANKGYQLRQMKGNFLFNNNDLAISGFSGFVGESDFELTGLIKNFLAFSVLENQSIGIEADFSSNHLNLDQLLAGHTFEQKTDNDYHFSISPMLYLKLNCDIDHLQFRRFESRNLVGNLSVKKQVASTNSIKLETMGGDISLAGSINAQSDSIYVSSNADLSHIHIDSLFYVFENFNQSFLVDQNLKGVVNAHINNFVNFDQSLNVNPSSIRADINTTIIKGELNDFEPMQKLAKYIDGDKLDRLKFAELANDIHVENQIIYLPSMQVNSNVTNITIGGTHTFDQHIDYSVVAPFNNKKKKDKDEAFGAIETSQTGQTKVFLKITGTTSDYKISFDKSAFKKEVIGDLKREVQQLKEAFRKKGTKKKEEVALDEEDYFDW